MIQVVSVLVESFTGLCTVVNPRSEFKVKATHLTVTPWLSGKSSETAIHFFFFSSSWVTDQAVHPAPGHRPKIAGKALVDQCTLQHWKSSNNVSRTSQ